MKDSNEKQNTIHSSKQVTPRSITPPKFSPLDSNQKLSPLSVPKKKATFTTELPKRNELPINSPFQLSIIDNKHNISEDIINESVLNEIPTTLPRLSQANVELVQHLTESPFISRIVVSLTQTNPVQKDLYGKIIFSMFNEELYAQPFYFYYECDRIAAVLYRAQKLFSLRNKLKKPNQVVKDNSNSTFCFCVNEVPPVESSNVIVEHNQHGGNGVSSSGGNNKNVSPLKNNALRNKLNMNQHDEYDTNVHGGGNNNMNSNNNAANRQHKTNLFQVSPISTNMKVTYTPSITDNNNVNTLSNTKQATNSNTAGKTTNTNSKKKQTVRFHSTTITEDNVISQRSPPHKTTNNTKNSNIKKLNFNNNNNTNAPKNRNASRNQKQQTKPFPKETPLFNSTNMTSLFLTKIPNRVSNESNLQLDLAYSKAKDAARVVRRLEYSYNMKLSMMYSKPIHKKNARVIQNWWRTLQFRQQTNVIIKNIQKYIRGYLSRVSFTNVLHVYRDIIPFLKVVDKIISRRLYTNAFHKLLCKYGILKIHRLIKPKAQLIIKHLNEFTKEMELKRQIRTFNKKKCLRCVMNKYHIEYEIRKYICKLQARIKGLLLRGTENGRLDIARRYHPYLYYYLKYAHNNGNGSGDKYKDKLNAFKNIVRFIKERNLKINYNVNNCYEYLNYILKRRIWNEFKGYYYVDKTEMNPIKKRRNELKLLAKRKLWKDNKCSLSKYFTRWKLYCKSYTTIIKPTLYSKLDQIWLIFLYHKKVMEQIFLYKLNYIKHQQHTNQNNALTRLINIYSKRTTLNNDKLILNAYFQKWKKQHQLHKLNSVNTTLNTFFKNAYHKLQQEKKQKLIRLFNVYQHSVKDRFHKWRFENIRYKLLAHKLFKLAKRKVLLSKRLFSLRKNMNSLCKRQLKYKRKTFKTFQRNTGMLYRHFLTTNVQISFYHKNRKYFSLRKYRMLKYMINKMNNLKRINHWDRLKYEVFTLWKSSNRFIQFKSTLNKFITKRINLYDNLKLQKMMVWYRKVLMLNIKVRTLFLQRQIKKYLKRVIKPSQK